MNKKSSNTNRKHVLRNVAVAGTATAAWAITLVVATGLPSVAGRGVNHNETLLRSGRP